MLTYSYTVTILNFLRLKALLTALQSSHEQRFFPNDPPLRRAPASATAALHA